MKKNLIYLLGLLVLSTSCEDILTYESSTIIVSENAINTQSDLEMALNGAYSAFASGGHYGGKQVILADLMADDGNIRASKLGNFDTKEVFNGETNGQQSSLRDLWKDAYFSIDRANTVIRAIDENWGSDDLSGNTQMKGEALAMRAMAHYSVLRFFAQPYKIGGDNSGPGAVLRLESTVIEDGEDLSSLQSERASIEESYAAITADLEAAIPMLSTGTSKGYINSYAAQAFLARVYFFQGNYNKAFEHAQAVIDGPYGLDTDDNLMGPHANTGGGSGDGNEIIFQIVIQNHPTKSGDGVSWAYDGVQTSLDTVNFGNNVAILVADTLLALIDTADLRFKTVMGYHKTDSSKVYTRKWSFCDDETQVGDPITEFCSGSKKDVTVIRLSEMYLIAGESSISAGYTGSVDKGDEYINVIRSRAGLAPLSGATLADYELERRIELCFENDRLHNLRRLQKDIREGVAFDDKDFILAIPDGEVGGNPIIQQNP